MPRPFRLINTPLQRGATVWRRGSNRFSGFRRRQVSGSDRETAEAVRGHRVGISTPLKRGVNERPAESN